MSVDPIIELVGKWNIVNVIWCLIINFLKSMTSCAASFAFLWANARPFSVRCKLPVGYHVNGSVPFELVKDKWTPSKCLQYKNFTESTNQTEKCQLGYVYAGYFKSSTVTEWDLVCDKRYLAALADSSFFILSVIGSALFTGLGDYFGRRPVFISCLLSLSAMGYLQTLSPNPYTYVTFRLLLGPLQQGTYTMGYCYALELFPKSESFIPVFISEMAWVLSGCILSLIVYFVRDWKAYYCITNLPFLFGIVLILFMPESIPWLFAKGKTDAAFKTLTSKTKLMKNKEEIIQKIEDERIKQQIFGNTTETQSDAIYPFYFVCTQQYIQKWSIINGFVWFSIGLVYYAFNVYGTKFGNVFLNFFLLFIIDIPAVFSSSYITKNIGRKLANISNFIFLGITLIFIFLGITYMSNAVVLNIVLVVSGRFFATIVFDVLFFQTCEMYPTSLRSMGMIIGTSTGRLGVALYPFIRVLEDEIDYLPIIVIVGFCFTSACLYYFLPETLLWKHPQTLSEIHQFRTDPEYQIPLCQCMPLSGVSKKNDQPIENN